MFLFKGGLSLIIGIVSFNSNENVLFSLLCRLKLSKNGEWLQGNKLLLTNDHISCGASFYCSTFY